MSPGSEEFSKSARPAGTTTESRIIAILEAFERQVAGVRGSAVADRDGLPIANGFKEPFDLLSVASMGALGMESARKVSEFVGVQAPKAVIMESEDAKIVIRDLGQGRASLIVVIRPETNLGFAKLQIEAAARRLEEELGFLPSSGKTELEEVFLLTIGGLLITHLSRRMIHPKDRDLLAAMFTVVQEFVKDSFQGQGGALKEMELANFRVRLVRGRATTLAFLSHGALTERFLDHAAGALTAFEDANQGALDPWVGDASKLKNVDQLLEELLSPQVP